MTDPASRSEDVFDVDTIRRFVELMHEHELSEIDLRQNDQRIRLKRGPGLTLGPMVSAPGGDPAAPATASSMTGAPPAPVPTQAELAAQSDNIVEVKSPMVGTFYSKPNPDAELFVTVGVE